MTAAARRRGIAGMSLIALTMVAVLLSLGFWQVQRRDEKHRLIRALHERLAAEPAALPVARDWPVLDPVHDEFRRVRFIATYRKLPDAMVYSSGSAVRDDVAGPGTWAFLPAVLPDGRTVVVNAGFVPNTMPDRGAEDRAVQPLLSGHPATLTGYVRFPEQPGLFAPAPNLDKRLWFARDVPAMAAALGWDKPTEVAPFYVDLESPVPASGVPKPGPLGVYLRDNHMQYAVTWFGLAVAVLVAFGFWLRGQTRQASPVAKASRRIA